MKARKAVGQQNEHGRSAHMGREGRRECARAAGRGRTQLVASYVSVPTGSASVALLQRISS